MNRTNLIKEVDYTTKYANYVNPKLILEAKRYFDKYPNRPMIWYGEFWTKEDFYKWFRHSLMHKCLGDPYFLYIKFRVV